MIQTIEVNYLCGSIGIYIEEEQSWHNMMLEKCIKRLPVD